MEILLYIALGYLVGTSFIFFLNRYDFTALLPSRKKTFPERAPVVSICIPARNEEAVIERCVRSALDQDYPELEVIVLDDESDDNTPEVLQKLLEIYPSRLKVLQGSTKPSGWLGKPWACHQIAKEAKGSILMFIDADTWLQKDMVSKSVRTMGHDVVDFITIWPMQKMETFWEKAVIPLVYYALLSLLPARYVQKPPKWVPKPLRPLIDPLFAAACGQCMIFKRTVYDTIGGHESVKDKVVEDVALSKVLKKHGYRMKMYHGEDSISCRMYTSGKELKKGFSKNFLAGFGYNILAFIIMGLLHLIVFILPFLLLPFAIWTQSQQLLLLSSLCILIIITHRLMLAKWFNWSRAFAFLHPVSVLWFQRLGLKLIINHLRGVKASWKGRSID